jgi:hypothetical protein
MQVSTHRKLAVITSTFGLLVWAPPAAAQMGLPTDLRPGKRVEDHGVAVIVPPRGHSVFAEALTVDGSQELGVETTIAGEVIISDWGDESDMGDDSDTGAPGQCNDGAYSLRQHRWPSSYRWYFNAGSTPDGVNLDRAEEAMRDAVRNIVFANNTCGLADNVSATAAYQGRTNMGVQITSDSACYGVGNGTSSVSFGTLPQGTLGRSCVWVSLDGVSAYEGDVRLNKAHHSWFARLWPSCSGKWSIETVMTHEHGHTFGLGHASPESEHKWLTMSPGLNGTCQESETTLGLGDIRGLEQKY